MRADDGGLRVRDRDREHPETHADADPEAGPHRRGEADIGRPELRPREEEDDEPETERDVLGRGEDADLFGRELVEVTDRDGERARGREDGDVRNQERGDGADEDRPEAPERRRGGRVGRL